MAVKPFMLRKESKPSVSVRRYSDMIDPIDELTDFELVEELEFVPVSDGDTEAANQTYASATSNDATTTTATQNKSYSLRESTGRKFSRSLCAQSESDTDTEYTPRQSKKPTKRKPTSADSEEEYIAKASTKPDEPVKSMKHGAHLIEIY